MSKLAIVTGASRGIGKAAANYFASQGYDIALIATNEALLGQVSTEIKQAHSVNTGVFAIDVRDKTAIDACIQQIQQHHDSIDILFNCAGVLYRGSSDISPDDFDKMIDINIRGVYHMVHSVAPIMKQQRFGYIFNLASNSGKRPLAGVGAYCLSKFGVVGYSQSLSLELVKYNVKVTALCPSVIDTDMTKDFSDFPNSEKIQCQDIMTSIDYLLKLGPNAYVDEIVIKSSYLMKQNAP